MTMGGSAHSLGVNRVGGLKHFQKVMYGITNSTNYKNYKLATELNGDYATLIVPSDQVPRVYDSFQGISANDQGRATAALPTIYPTSAFTTYNTTDPTQLDYLDPEASDTGFRCVIPVN